jgi:hypothetical protein
VELVDVAAKAVFFRAAGLEEEDLRRVVIDLSKMQGKEIQIRVVDKHTGHWGHVNFDDFRFHTAKPTFPQRPAKTPPPKQDVVLHAGLAPEAAAKAMTVPEGFSVTLFAGEPDVHQPIAFCTDDRGRLWVVEAFTYPRRNPHPGPVIPAKAENPTPQPPPRSGFRVCSPFPPREGGGGVRFFPHRRPHPDLRGHRRGREV